MEFSKLKFLLLIAITLCKSVIAQNYNATLGSSYAGSMGVANNPASILHMPFKWDITPFAIQEKHSTNSLNIKGFSLLSQKDAEAINKTGDFKRFGFATQDARLLNARFSLGSKSAIAFGLNMRNYTFAKTSKLFATDTSQDLRSFLTQNIANRPLNAQFNNNGWIEFFGTYSQTIWQNDYDILNAGISVKITRGIFGGFVRIDNVDFKTNTSGDFYYNTFDGNLQYGYSSNFDRLDKNLPDNNRTNDFLRTTQSSIAFDLGIEYILKQDEKREYDGEIYPYDWKFGIAIMDIGFNRFKYGIRSRTASGLLSNVSDTALENKFNNINNFDQFNDSLATIVKSIQAKTGFFNFWQPMRLVLNIDKNIDDYFFVNGQLTLPLMSLAGKEYLYINDINLITITPRWETKNLGFYLPIQYNTKNQFWIGGAFKAGPLLLGIHNWANLFSKNKMANGGFYLALTIRSRSNNGKDEKTPKYMQCKP